MADEVSCGVIPLRKSEKGEWEVLLVQHRTARYWGFPKGHTEGGETLFQTATRELFEETGLKILRVIHSEPVEERFHFDKQGVIVDKIVYYFLCEVEGNLRIQEEEVGDARWVMLQDIPSILTYESTCQAFLCSLKNLKRIDL